MNEMKAQNRKTRRNAPSDKKTGASAVTTLPDTQEEDNLPACREYAEKLGIIRQLEKQLEALKPAVISTVRKRGTVIVSGVGLLKYQEVTTYPVPKTEEWLELLRNSSPDDEAKLAELGAHVANYNRCEANAKKWKEWFKANGVIEPKKTPAVKFTAAEEGAEA